MGVLNRARTWWRSPRGLAVGAGSSVHASVVVENADVVVGARTRLQRDVFIRGPQVRIGNRVFCNDGVYINHHVTIEDEVSIGQFTRLITGGHQLGPGNHRAGTTTTEPIVIGRGSWLGASVTVLPGVTVGAGCVIASGAVVTRDCAPNGLYAGVPAVRKRDLPAD
jgi:maltose O-acetyltransferase